MKTLDEYFLDWEAHVFGHGCGVGEMHIMPALQKVMDVIPEEGCYKYRDIEQAVGPVTGWLFINTLCHHNILEWGTCSTFGWLTESGKELKKYLQGKIFEEDNTECDFSKLLDSRQEHNYCYPTACNCGPNGYEKGRVCANPFWINK